MKIELKIMVDVSEDGVYVEAPEIMDLYPAGFIQAGKAELEGNRKWKINPEKKKQRCPYCRGIRKE